MRLHRLSVCLVLLAAALAWASCARATPQPTPSPLPSPIPSTPTPTLLPREYTPQPDRGIVQGTLSLLGKPAAGQVLYLAEVIRQEGEAMGVAALDAATAPRAESDASGYFVFLGVSPARYALGILGPGGPLLVRQATGQEVLLQVEAGQINDLGEIQITPFLP
jgi:hypothetical protein